MELNPNPEDGEVETYRDALSKKNFKPHDLLKGKLRTLGDPHNSQAPVEPSQPRKPNGKLATTCLGDRGGLVGFSLAGLGFYRRWICC